MSENLLVLGKNPSENFLDICENSKQDSGVIAVNAFFIWNINLPVELSYFSRSSYHFHRKCPVLPPCCIYPHWFVYKKFQLLFYCSLIFLPTLNQWQESLLFLKDRQNVTQTILRLHWRLIFSNVICPILQVWVGYLIYLHLCSFNH